MNESQSARALLRGLLEQAHELPGPWSFGDGTGTRPEDPLSWPGYPQKLEASRAGAGTDESVIAVRGTMGGTEAVFVAWEFGFLGGSMGLEAGERIARAYDEARRNDLPIVLLPATGGARMQEGMVALSQMAKTAVAAQAHARAGLLQVAVLRDPTTGGVFASHGNLADIALAQRGATIGFAGPRVAETMTGGPLPEGSHTAEGAFAAGLVDEVVDQADLVPILSRLLRWAHPGPLEDRPDPRGESGSEAGPELAEAHEPQDGSSWDAVQEARSQDRPRARAFLDGLDVAFELHGDRAGADDDGVRVALAHLGVHPIVVVAMDRQAPSGARLTPAAYRKAWRGLDIADRSGAPLLTLVDTPGADAGASSEAGGIANHIAETFRRLLDVRAPTVCVVIGEGGSGGALALAVTDRLVIQEHAVFHVIAPEGAVSILHRDASEVPEVAELLKPTSWDLQRLGIADRVVAEPGGQEVATVLRAVEDEIGHLAREQAEERLDRRHRRWRQAGNPRRAATR